MMNRVGLNTIFTMISKHQINFIKIHIVLLYLENHSNNFVTFSPKTLAQILPINIYLYQNTLKLFYLFYLGECLMCVFGLSCLFLIFFSPKFHAIYLTQIYFYWWTYYFVQKFGWGEGQKQLEFPVVISAKKNFEYS